MLFYIDCKNGGNEGSKVQSGTKSEKHVYGDGIT